MPAAASLTAAVLLTLLLMPLHAWGQGPATIIVRVGDEAGRPLPAAQVTLLTADSVPLRSEVTDAAGNIRITTPAAGRYVLRAERLGFATEQREVLVDGVPVVRLNVVLRPAAVGLPGLLVEAERRRARFEESAGATVGELTRRELKLLPAPGEADVLRAVEVLPGVVSTSDFSAAFNVRGGSADQNLILLDGLPIYNPFHLGGLFSVFNADMVGRMELLAGGFPARYGGRVSSVLSVESDAGTGETPAVEAGISLLSARAALATDLPAGLRDAAGLRSGRARLSLRRSYFDQLLRPVLDFPYHLTDAQAFADVWTHGGGRLTVTAYTGRDVLDLAGADSFPLHVRWTWGNDVVGATWTAPLRGGTAHVRTGYSRFGTAIRFPEFDDTEFRGRIEQFLLAADVTVPYGAVELGFGAAFDRLDYANRAETGGAVFRATGSAGWLLGQYAQARWRGGPWLIEAGLRSDAWLTAGRDEALALQPRVAVKRFLGADLAVKAAFGRYAQYAHSLRDEELPLGIDIWVLAGERAPHVVSDQVQLGVEGYLGADWFGSIEAFHRRFDGVVTTNSGDDPDDPLDDLHAGRGLSWGADFHVRRESGRVRPMLAVSWLRAWREFDDAFAEPGTPPLRYAPVFDRRLDIDLFVQAMLPRDIQLGVRWNLGTGLPYTRPLGAHVYYEYSMVEGRWRFRTEESDTMRSAIVLGPRNAERYPVYHRLDAGLRKTYRKRWGSLTPHLDLLNAYDRRNVLFYFYEYDRDPPTRSGLSMFPFLPTAGIEVRF